MDLREKLGALQQEFIQALSGIKEFPEGLLPHLVFAEEEADSRPIYKEYSLTKIYPDGKCVLQDPETKMNELGHLNEINIDWLATVWGYYQDLMIENNKEHG